MELGRNGLDQRFSSLEDDFAEMVTSALRYHFRVHDEGTAADKAGA